MFIHPNSYQMSGHKWTLSMSQIECGDYDPLSWNLKVIYISICLGSKARGTAKRKWTPNKRDGRAHYIGFRRWSLMKTIYLV